MNISKLIYLLDNARHNLGPDTDVVLYDHTGQEITEPVLRGLHGDVHMDPATDEVTVRTPTSHPRGTKLDKHQAAFVERAEAETRWHRRTE